ncbi:MAG: NAD(P)-binding domain-containing protein [Candidatus Nitrosocosmicus sp.]
MRNAIQVEKNKTFQNTFQKVIVIGLGQLGLPVAKYVKEHGFDTYGYDINQKAMQSAETNYGIKQATHFGEFDVLIVCVSTHVPNDMFSPQIDGLMSVVEKISREAKSGALISIESTIPKGTSKKVFEKVDHRLHVVHAPHRWYALEEEIHGVNQLRIVGGVSNCCLQHGLNFYDGRTLVSEASFEGAAFSSISAPNTMMRYITPSVSKTSLIDEKNDPPRNYFMNIADNKDMRPSLLIPMHPVSSSDVAEVTKIVENAYRYLQIAFAEELLLYCISNNISFTELREALNTKWNVDILEPRDGIAVKIFQKMQRCFSVHLPL